MPKNRLRKGIFITFEGVEGCGKSTHAKLIFRYLKKAGYDCVLTREPGGTKIGEMIRNILLNPKNASLNDTTELFLFEANRAQVVDEVIRPALKENRIVVCDRFFDATMAYQGYANRFDKKMIKRMSEFATGGLKPHLTVVLDINTKEGLRRSTHLTGKDRMEEKCLVRLITTRKNINLTQELIRHEVLGVLKRYKISR
jgi:dTMP kinase